jgi:hypothetical protein
MKIKTRLKLNTVLAAESNQMAAGLEGIPYGHREPATGKSLADCSGKMFA